MIQTRREDRITHFGASFNIRNTMPNGKKTKSDIIASIFRDKGSLLLLWQQQRDMLLKVCCGNAWNYSFEWHYLLSDFHNAIVKGSCLWSRIHSSYPVVSIKLQVCFSFQSKACHTIQSHGISCYSHGINLLIRVHQHNFPLFFVSHRMILKAMHFYW